MTAITKTNGNGPGAQSPQMDIMEYAGNLSHAQVELVKQAVITGGTRPVTNNELALFLTVCGRRGLDPFSGQVYGIMRKSKEKDGTWVEKLVIQVGIDGYRLLAEQTGKYEGIAGPFWCGADGQWVDVWLSDKPPAAAKVGVYRAGCREPFWAVCTYREYVQTRDGKPIGKWQDMPANQLAKCCEAAAIRKAFPQAVGGVTTAEMAAADTETYDVTEGDRVMARITEQEKARKASTPRAPWREEIDNLVDVPVRVIAGEGGEPASKGDQPDRVAEAIEGATTVAAIEAVATSAPGWNEELHRPLASARLVKLVAVALAKLDFSRPDAVEKSLAAAVIKLDPLPRGTPGLDLAFDQVEDARQKLAENRSAGKQAA